MAWSLFSSGASPRSWASSLLSRLGAPQTAANQQSLIAWALREGGGGTFNPLNTTLSAPGASCLNSVCVRNYTSWSQGIEATANTIQGGNFSQILADLKSGGGVGGNAAGELLSWSGNGYSSLASTWGQAGQYMGGNIAPLPGGMGNIQTTSALGGLLGGGIGGSILGDIANALGLPSPKDMLIRLGLILLGGLLVLVGIFILVGKGAISTAITVAAPESRAGQVASGATQRQAYRRANQAASDAS